MQDSISLRIAILTLLNTFIARVLCHTHNLSIGRVTEPEKGIALVNAAIREGRTIEKRRALTLGFMDLLHKTWDIPKEHMYVTLTEHKGEDFHLVERYLTGWQEDEDPLVG